MALQYQNWVQQREKAKENDPILERRFPSRPIGASCRDDSECITGCAGTLQTLSRAGWTQRPGKLGEEDQYIQA